MKRVLKRCITCRRHEGGAYKLPPMCPLPKSRVTESTPFSKVGLDYLGPIIVKNGQSDQKVWICLFTCLVTRAIHLELVGDLSTAEFLLCFKRFVAQRGTPSDVISDNAMCFRTANSVFESVWKNIHESEDVWSYISSCRINWLFNVELAPWMGGFYERLVGLVKRSLRKTIGRRILSLSHMQTLIKEIESVLNSRPLVFINDDINSNIAITPSHFLTLNPKTGIPVLEISDDHDFIPNEKTSDKLVSLWKNGQPLLDVFWKIWRDEYLLSLRERFQTHVKDGRYHSNFSPKVNDIVIIKDDTPRGHWRFGKVVKLTFSKDSLVRSATVKVPSGREIRRPVNLLFPLEVSSDLQSTDVIDQNGKVENQDTKRPARKAALKASEQIKKML